MDVHFSPFDLEAAKNGAPVMTRGGGSVEFISFDLNDKYIKIAAIITEQSGRQHVESYGIDGSKDLGDHHSSDTLKMVLFGKMVKKWVNLYRGKGIEKFGNVFYDTKEQSEMGQPNEQTYKDMEYVEAIQVEIWYKTTCAGK